MQKMIIPHNIRYLGGLADENIIDCYELSKSISGASKISNSIIHFISEGRVPKGNYKKTFRCVTEVPRPGSYELLLCFIPIAGHSSLYTEEIIKSTQFLFQSLWGFIINPQRQNTEQMKNTIDGFVEVNRQNQETIRTMSSDHKEVLQELVKSNRGNARDYVSPVGNSCDQIHNHFDGDFYINIDINIAKDIRSRTEEIGEETDYICNRMTRLNLETGHCRLELLNSGGKVTGWIFDSTLKEPGNVYSAALNEQFPLILSARAKVIDGKIKELYITNAYQLK